MEQERIEGIVLRAMEYKDTQRLVTLFSPTGLYHIVVKRLSSKRVGPLLASSPFSKSECIVQRGQSALFSCSDLSLLDDYSALRTRYAFMEAAGSLARAVLHTQLPGKPAPLLYQLLELYLQKIPLLEEQTPLVVSFQLKLLKHEGLLRLSMYCPLCPHQPAAFLLKGESLCSMHDQQGGISFSREEWALLLSLCEARYIDDLRSHMIPPSFVEKVQTYFYTFPDY